MGTQSTVLVQQSITMSCENEGFWPWVYH
uniref:Uncharacterized protein n=1 Tax=Anguilla anguilla TaxID=7936 RepID=A0A0E9XJA0_ANGAN